MRPLRCACWRLFSYPRGRTISFYCHWEPVHTLAWQSAPYVILSEAQRSRKIPIAERHRLLFSVCHFDRRRSWSGEIRISAHRGGFFVALRLRMTKKESGPMWSSAPTAEMTREKRLPAGINALGMTGKGRSTEKGRHRK